MSKRQRIFETEHLVALGNERGLVIVFKGDPAVMSHHEICHASLGKVMQLGPGVTAPHIRAVAILRGRGVFMQYINPNPHYMTYVTMPPQVGYWAADGMVDDPQPAKYLSLQPCQTKWADGKNIISSLIRPRAVTTEISAQQQVQAHNPQDLIPPVNYAGAGNAITFNNLSNCISSVSYETTQVGHAIDAYVAQFPTGYSGHHIRVAPVDKGHELNEIIDCMTSRLVPKAAPDQYGAVSPMSMNDYCHKLEAPSWRRMMIKGGAIDLVEYITGTRSKQMMRMLMPLLFRESTASLNTSSSASQFAATIGYVSGAFLNTSYFEMRNLLRSMSVDHRIRYMKLYLRQKTMNQHVSLSNYVGVGGGAANYWYQPQNNNSTHDNVMEFFAVAGDHTKILNKVEADIDLFERSIGMRMDEVERAVMDPFTAMNDTGSQLHRWRNAKLSRRQAKYFPNGIVIKKWQTITDIHDDVSKQANRLESLGELIHMPWQDDTMPLHGMKCGEVTLLLPRTNMALVRWGKAQGHCVGSMYNQSMQRGDCQIVGAFVGGKVMYCIRLSKLHPIGVAIEKGDESPWALSEFRGKGNCWPTVEHAALVLEMLDSVGVSTMGWAESQNGYGRGKHDNWNHDLEQHRETIPHEVIMPPTVVRNFTKGLGPELNDVAGLQL